ncbi:hypothetical protein [Porphyrobacter sp. LM 6]|jgi:hypothetical protein|uniref:hypothetical protein n=1 Tax=Porphyrobacter sp. LM 6 TaxID=1896196 RepID=UPI000846A83B|nr:hypothetical protein [Porphyrobacter sp. LM 6]AOL95528.1 hypothetical protein BG023_112618 [Porphyrobacter sp. LM 6]
MENIDVFLPYVGWIITAGFALGAMGIIASFQTTRMKIKNGYPLEGMWGQSLKPGSDKETAHRVTLLTQENAELRAELGSMKDRLANVERIVTDGGYHLGAEIDALRDRALENLSDKGKA